MSAKCKHCDARITWAVLVPGDKRIPMDPVPNPSGGFTLWSSNPDLPMEASKVDKTTRPKALRFTAHTDTCPNQERKSRPWNDPTDPGPREP